MDNDLRDVLSWLAEQGEDGVSAETVAEGVRISLARARHFLRELNRKGLVWEDEDGNSYGLTEEGDRYVVDNELDYP